MTTAATSQGYSFAVTEILPDGDVLLFVYSHPVGPDVHVSMQVLSPDLRQVRQVVMQLTMPVGDKS